MYILALPALTGSFPLAVCVVKIYSVQWKNAKNLARNHIRKGLTRY